MEQRTEDTEKEEQAQVGADYGPPSTHASGSGFDIEVSTPSPLETHSSARIYSSSSGYGAGPSCSSGPPNRRSENLMGYISRGRADHTYSSVPPTATQQNENLMGNIFTGPSYSSDPPNATQSSGNLMGHIFTGYGASPSYSSGPPTATQQNGNLMGNIFTGPSYSSNPPNATQSSGNMMGNIFTGYGASPSYSLGPPTATQQNENLMGSIFTVYGTGPSYSSGPPKATQRSGNLVGNIFTGYGASPSYSSGPPTATQRNENMMGDIFTGYGARPSYSSGPPKATQHSEHLMGNIFTGYGARPSYSSGPPKATQHSEHLMANIFTGYGASPSYSSGPPKATQHSENLMGNIQYASSSYSYIPGTRVPTATAPKVHGCLNTSASPTCNRTVSSTVTSSAYQSQQQEVEETFSHLNEDKFKFGNQPQVYPRLKVEEPLSYLDKVRITFINRPQVYEGFLDIIKEYKSKRTDIRDIILRVKRLFKGHPELIEGFNAYVPPRYHIGVQSSDQGHSSQVSISKPSPSSVTAVSTHVPAGMVTQHLSIPGNLNTLVRFVPIPATATRSSPVTTKIVKPIHRPTHYTAAAVASASTTFYQRPAYHTAAAVASASTTVYQRPAYHTAAAVASASTTVYQRPAYHTAAAVASASTTVYQRPAYHTAAAVASASTTVYQRPAYHTAAAVASASTTVYQRPAYHTAAAVASASTTVYQRPAYHTAAAVASASTTVYQRPAYHTAAAVASAYADYHRPTHHTAAAVAPASAVYQNVSSATAATKLVPAVASMPLPTPAISHHVMPPSTAPFPVSSRYISAAHAVSHAAHNVPQRQGQRVDFNQAINYINKVKLRFQDQPDQYKKFIEIVRTYQKEQRKIKQGIVPTGKHSIEAEVYSQVAKLFQHHDDLLAEFGLLLPDVTSHQASLEARLSSRSDHSTVVKRSPGPKPGDGNTSCSSGGRAASLPTKKQRAGIGSSKSGHSSGQIKSSSSLSASVSGSGVPRTQTKKHKLATLRNITITEARKHSTSNDFAFFDKVRKALKNREAYNNLLRCLKLFNDEIVSSSELIELVKPFLGKFPELFNWFKKFMRRSKNLYQLPGSSHNNESETSHSNEHSNRSIETLEEIDYTTCKRLGSSYCALPENYKLPKCSGRTPLCNEVINDTWVSFPSRPERSTFVTPRKTKYEEFIFRCEDEMFEVDIVIETNTATISVFERVKKRMSQMSPEDITKFRLDDCLGGSSPTVHLRAVRRLYGDKAPQIIDGLKNNPSVAVPVVLKRLKSKGEEWRKAQQDLKKFWREQTKKYYLRSLDYQSRRFKQNDIKALRSRSMFNEIKTIFDVRHEQAEEATGDVLTGPHLTLPYKKKCMLDDTANLLLHHVKRQTGIHKEEKDQVKLILRHLIPDMFYHPRQDLSEDEREEEEKTNGNNQNVTSNTDQSCKNTSTQDPNDQELPDIEKPEVSLPRDAKSSHSEKSYTLFYCNKYWYHFLRLHQIICDRLANMYERARVIADEESNDRKHRKESLVVALRIKQKSEIEVEDYYPAFLGMIKNLLDGNIDNRTFEGKLREMFGNCAYLSCTIDKVISYAVRQLQNLVTDEMCREVLDLYHQESKHGGTGGDCQTSHLRIAAELSYQQKAEKLLSKENCFKIVIYNHDCQLTVELLDNEENSRPDPEPHEKSPVFGEGCSASAADGTGCTQTSATVTASEIRDCDDDQMDLSAEYSDEVAF